jgi:hypothetical protein
MTPAVGNDNDNDNDEKNIAGIPPTEPVPVLETQGIEPPLDLEGLQKTFVRAIWLSLGFTFIVGICIPMPLFGANYVFSRRFFEVWIG